MEEQFWFGLNRQERKQQWSKNFISGKNKPGKEQIIDTECAGERCEICLKKTNIQLLKQNSNYWSPICFSEERNDQWQR